MSKDVDEILEYNKPRGAIQTPDADEGNLQEFKYEDELYTTKLKEKHNDAGHSLQNTELLNKAYSQLIVKFFSGKWFYFWLIFLLILFILSDEYILQLNLPCIDIVNFIAKKFLYALGMLFVAMLGFPTAKGIRNLFKGITEKLIKKP